MLFFQNGSFKKDHNTDDGSGGICRRSLCQSEYFNSKRGEGESNVDKINLAGKIQLRCLKMIKFPIFCLKWSNFPILIPNGHIHRTERDSFLCHRKRFWTKSFAQSKTSFRFQKERDSIRRMGETINLRESRLKLPNRENIQECHYNKAAQVTWEPSAVQ